MSAVCIANGLLCDVPVFSVTVLTHLMITAHVSRVLAVEPGIIICLNQCSLLCRERGESKIFRDQGTFWDERPLSRTPESLLLAPDPPSHICLRMAGIVLFLLYRLRCTAVLLLFPFWLKAYVIFNLLAALVLSL